MIAFEQYSKIYNNYCVCYFAGADEYLVQLTLLRPIIEQKFPNLNIYIGCADESKRIAFLKNDPKTLTKDELRLKKNNFAHIHELKFNGETREHPIEHFLSSSGITEYDLNTIPQTERTVRCLIAPRSCHPTKDLTRDQIDRFKVMAEDKGFVVDVGDNIKGAGLVIGPENPCVFQAAAKGVKTILVSNGVGTHLYKKMFPFGEVSA